MTHLHKEFDFSKRELFRTAYHEAVDKKRTEFIFENHLYDVGYARYLLEYLDERLARPAPLVETLKAAIKDHGGFFNIDSTDWDKLKELVERINNIRNRRK